MFPRKPNTLVFAIVLSGALVGGAILYTQNDDESADSLQAPLTTSQALDAVRPVQANDHVWGNPNAAIVLVTYSDFSCPFCKEYHATMHDIIDFHGRDGSVAWVFRQMPLVQLHAEAPMYALASECVAEHGGNRAFWTFSDSLFEAIDIDVKPDTNKLLQLAESAGIARTTFTSCMRENALMDAVEQDFDEAVSAGATASPFTVLLTPDGRTSFLGAREFQPLSLAIQAALQAVGTSDTLVSPSEADNATRFDPEETIYSDTTVDEGSLVPTPSE